MLQQRKSKLYNYFNHVFQFNFNAKIKFLKWVKNRRRRGLFLRHVKISWKLYFKYPHLRLRKPKKKPKSSRYWKLPGLKKIKRFFDFWQFIRKYKRFPWLTELFQRQSIFKWNFKRPFFLKKYPSKRKHNIFYQNEFYWYTMPKSRTRFWKKTLIKPRLQIRPIVRYFVYMPYLQANTVKNLNKKTVALKKKLSNGRTENYWIKYYVWQLQNILSRFNLASNKQNANFLVDTQAVAIHNSQSKTLEKLKKTKPVHKMQPLTIDWKRNTYTQTNISVQNPKKGVNHTESISVNHQYNSLNWAFFLSINKQKFVPTYASVNSSRNIVFLKKTFLYRYILKNERLCKQYWTPLSLLIKKINFCYI